MQYRREVDGLRAVAVIPVILFHAGIEGFAGGFVGVDVFFVISGYLITTIIYSDVAEHKYSIAAFYERRVRRIIPALALVCAATLPFAYALMLPGQFTAFGKRLAATTIFFSNIIFWSEHNYFSPASQLNPLIHTWSLAVEEQFYIFFPPLLYILRRLNRRVLLILLVMTSLFSLALAQWASRFAPTADFYLLPFRWWELGMGAILSLSAKEWSSTEWRAYAHGRVAEIGALAGVAMIGYAIFTFDSTLPFPSAWALLPDVGSALIIVFAVPQTIVGRLLSTPLFVGIGLISYSAYLWHQVIFAFSRLAWPDLVSPTMLLGLAVISLGLAYLSWRFVETPFRDRRKYSRGRIFLMGAAASVALGAVGTVGYYGVLRPVSYRSAVVRRMMSYDDYDPDPSFRTGICFYENGQAHFKPLCVDKASRYLVWGDSHAAGIYYGLAQVERESGRPLSQITTSACPPDLGYGGLGRDACVASNAFAFQEAKAFHSTVIMDADWLAYAQLRKDKFYTGFAATIRKLKAASVRVIVVLSVPQWTPTAPTAWLRLRAKAFRQAGVEYIPNLRYGEVEAVDRRLQEILRAEDTSYVSLINRLCEQRDGIAYCAVGIPHEEAIIPFQFDYGHLTTTGSEYVAKFILKQVAIRSVAGRGSR